jgi:hypothetical protein
MAVPGNAPQTTRFTRIVTAIADIVALENSRYDDVIPARHLYHLFEATEGIQSSSDFGGEKGEGYLSSEPIVAEGGSDCSS